jgi:hypothetical protein
MTQIKSVVFVHAPKMVDLKRRIFRTEFDYVRAICPIVLSGHTRAGRSVRLALKDSDWFSSESRRLCQSIMDSTFRSFYICSNIIRNGV